MASPTKDGSATGDSHGTSSVAATLTTSNTNDVIILDILYETATNSDTISVSSITASGLTFAQRSTIQVTGNFGFGGHATTVNLDRWWAPSTGALTGETITVNFNKNMDSASLIAYGVSGAANISSPFDSNVSLPATGSATNATPSSISMSFSTTQADDLLLAAWGSSASGSNLGTTDGTSGTYTNIAVTNEGAGTNYSYISCDYSSKSSPQSSVTASNTTSGVTFGNVLAMVDAITADSSTTTYNVSVSETGSAADTPSEAFTVDVSVSETGSAADSVSSADTFNVSVLEAGSAADSVSETVTGSSHAATNVVIVISG
jgi:hypothetical protein